MELTLRFDDLLSLQTCLTGLMDAKFVSPSMPVRIATAYRQIEPVCKDIVERYDALIKEHGEKDADGELIYLNEEKTQIKSNPRMAREIDRFMAGTVQVTVPVFDAVDIRLQGDEPLSIGRIFSVAPLFDNGTVTQVSLTRDELVGVAAGIGSLMGESLADPVATIKVAHAQNEVVRMLREAQVEGRVLAEEYAVRDGDGAIVYANPEMQDVSLTEEGRERFTKFGAQKVTLSVPEIAPWELVRADGTPFEPRKLLGIVAILKE